MDNQLKALLNASSRIAQERDVQKVLVLLADVTRSLLFADRASIYLHDKKSAELWTLVAHGVAEIRIPDSKGVAGHVWQTGETLNIKDAYQDPRFNQETDRNTGYQTKTLLAQPLLNQQGQILGVFQIINKKFQEEFGEEDIQLLKHLSLYVASTLENALLQSRLEKAQEDAIYRLSHATKYKDPETQNHIIRVGLYAQKMAHELGWNTIQQEMIKLAAPMHDIGKVGIPDSILQKPGRLTLDEWEIMKKHSFFGYEILKSENSELMQMASQVALDHHEKWDGSGYPFQKKGDEISLVGRLTAISDVFDALTSKRCYKEAWTFDKTKELLVSESGKHFDPVCMDAFLSSYTQMIDIRQAYQDE